MDRSIKSEMGLLYELGVDLNSNKNDYYLNALEKLWDENINYNDAIEFQEILLKHILGITLNEVKLYGVVYTQSGPQSPSVALVGAIKNLIAIAINGSNSIRTRLQESDFTIKNLKKEIQALNKKLSELNTIRENYRKANNELAQRNQKLKIEIKELKENLSELTKENNNLETVNHIFQGEIERLESITPVTITSSTVKSKEVAALSSKCESQQDEIDALKSKNQECTDALKRYTKLEKELLPLMVDTIYCTRKKGKSISLELSQIENIISAMLKGESKSSISNKYNVARSTITKVWDIDYTTSNSLKKICTALHNINGNWGSERKDILKEKISLCEDKLRQAKYFEENERTNIQENISGLSDFINALNAPKKEKYIKIKKSKNGSRYLDESEVNTENFYDDYPEEFENLK